MSGPMEVHAADASHEAFLDELKAALGNTGKDLPAQTLLAIASQFVGMLVAMQDQRSLTPEMAMEVVGRNLEMGNATAIEGVLCSPAGRA